MGTVYDAMTGSHGGKRDVPGSMSDLDIETECAVQGNESHQMNISRLTDRAG